MSSPAIILVRPQLGENIGMVARAMANFGLDRLRLVAPRDGWPSESAVAAASGADHVLDQACVYEDTETAVSDLRFVLASTVRERDMVKDVVDAKGAVARVLEMESAGFLFGPERSGLTNDEVTLADSILTIPVDPEFPSLNLAQAVGIVGYEWHALAAPGEGKRGREANPASAARAAKEDLIRLFEHLEAELDASGFLHPPEKRASMVRNIRNMIQRAGFNEQDVRTLRGIIASLGKDKG